MNRMIGIDENGYGPLMGPLVVTGVILQADGDFPDVPTLKAETGLDDSKKVFHRDHRRGESLALGVLENSGLIGTRADGGPPLSLHAILDRLVVRGPFDRPPSGCGSPAEAWGGKCVVTHGVDELPRWAKEPADIKTGMANLGIRVDRIAVAILCPGLFNEALAVELNKVDIDLRLFETVATVLASPSILEAVCGKIGSTNRYAKRFSRWAGRVHETYEEAKERSGYQIQGVGRVSFVKDADGTVAAVAIASVVGKYIRELWMEGLIRFVGIEGDRPSGYPGMATEEYIEFAKKVLPKQHRTGFPLGCLRRKR